MLLSLGKVDPGSMPADKAKYLKPFHGTMSVQNSTKMFKDEVRTRWKPFQALSGTSKPILALQTFLKDTGFLRKNSLF